MLFVSYILTNFVKTIGGRQMAIAIKTIPVLTGAAAERFNKLTEEDCSKSRTVIPVGMTDAIKHMMARSRKLSIK